MNALIYIPFFALLSVVFSSPAPVLEWDVVSCGENECTLHLELMGRTEGELSKLSIVPAHSGTTLSPAHATIGCDDHWVRQNALNWMWKTAPGHISMDVHVAWTADNLEANSPLLDVVWEQVKEGERQAWTLGSVELPHNAQPASTPPTGKRLGTNEDTSSPEITCEISGAEPGAFVKWTEYIPEGCTCTVLESSGASLRKSQNQQIFLWFEVEKDQKLAPKYILNCAERPTPEAFDGELEVAFGTETITSHIAGVEWEVSPTARLENMGLNQSPDVQSVAAHSAPNTGQLNPVGSLEPRFAVQLLANHRDLSEDEVAESTGYSQPFHIFRHQGWHKYLTDEVSTYADARELRSNIWTSTRATDAFITASLEGDRITVQEALLMSHQSWIP